MFKPLDEEPFAPNNPKGFVGKQLGAPGVSRAVRVGEAAFREVAAFLLDHGRFSRVPRTALVRVHHALATFHVNSSSGSSGGLRGNTSPPGKGADPPTAVAVPKLGSLQAYVRHDYDASEHGTSRFPAVEVHRLGILDVRLYNTDRHTGNILVCRRNALLPGGAAGGGIAAALEGDCVELVPIDHGYCLPEALESVYFEWLHWPQASMPFSRDTLGFISRLDGDADAQLLARELPSLRPGCGRLIQLTTRTLQAAAASGLCLADIGSLLSRPVVRIGEEPSALERLVEASLLALAAQVAGDAVAAAAAEAMGDAPAGVMLPPVCVSGGGGEGWGEEYPLGELSEGDEDAAVTPAAASHTSLPPTPAGGIARALASAAKSPQAAQGTSSLTALLVQQSAELEEEEEGGGACDGDDTATGTDDVASSPSCSDSPTSPAGTPRRTLVVGFAAPGDGGAAARRAPLGGSLLPGTPSAQPVPVPMRRTHSMPLNMPMVQSLNDSLGDDADGTGGGSSTSSSFGMSGPDSPAHHHHHQQHRHLTGGGHHHHRRQQQQQQARRGGVSSAPKHGGGPVGNPGPQLSAAATQSAAPRRGGTTSGQLLGRSVGALHASGLLSAPHRQLPCAPCAPSGAAAASSAPGTSSMPGPGGEGAAPGVSPWATFVDVPLCHWRAFLRIFEHQLAALLDAHPACRRPRGGGVGVLEAGEQRGNQLVTRGGTRVEAFGTSCPSAWLAERQRRTGTAVGW